MKGKRFTEEQIIAVLKEHEAGAKVPDLVRKYYVSEQSIYRWRSPTVWGSAGPWTSCQTSSPAGVAFVSLTWWMIIHGNVSDRLSRLGETTTTMCDHTAHWATYHLLCSPNRQHDMIHFPSTDVDLILGKDQYKSMEIAESRFQIFTFVPFGLSLLIILE